MGAGSRGELTRRAATTVAAASLALAVAGAAALLVAARASGVSYWGTSAAFVAGLPAATLVTAALAGRIRRQGDPVVGRWALGVAASLLAYLLATAGVTWAVAVQARDGPLLEWAALLALGGYVPTFVLLQATLVVTRDRLEGRRRGGRALVAGVLSVGTLGLLLGAAELDPDPPLGALDAPLAGTWVATAATVLSGPLWVIWLLSVLLGPVVLWRSVGRTTGMTRRRLSVAAVASLLPVSTIVCCALLLPVLSVAEVSQVAAVEVIFAFFSLTVPLTVAGLAVALSGQEHGLRLPTKVFRLTLDVTVGLLFALAALAVSTGAALALAGGSVPVVVLATGVVLALLWPVRRRAVRRLLLRADPRMRVAAELTRQAGAGTDRPSLTARAALRTALDEPDLEIALRLPGGAAWVSVDGDPMPAPDEQPAAHVTTVPDSDGVPHAYVLHTTTTADAAGTVAEVGPLLDRAVLEVTVRHQAEQLAAERARADAAAAAERRRLERDLHDGVQGRLLALALDLQAADASTSDGDAHLVLTDAVGSLRVAMDEMRRLASGAAPEMLASRGLAAALGDLARRLPVPVRLHVPEQRLDPTTESVAYLVVSEAVTNAVKHAGECSVDVELTLDAGQLGIRVADDGSGGADVRAGTGLRGLAERVGAVGGTLLVSDRNPSGTLVEAVLPCAR